MSTTVMVLNSVYVKLNSQIKINRSVKLWKKNLF